MPNVDVLYRRALTFPRLLLGIVLACGLLAGFYIQNLSFDASAETLVVQGDPNLATYRRMTELFGSDDFLVLTYARDDLFTTEALTELSLIQESVEGLPGVRNVFSMLDAPLIASPAVPLADMATGYRTLRSADVDLSLAQGELTRSPLFVDYLISRDGRATALRIDLQGDHELAALEEHRRHLRTKESPDAGESSELVRLDTEYHRLRMDFVADRELLITELRRLRDEYRGAAEIHMSGVPMIASLMIAYVKSDLVIFGSLVVLLIVVLLYFFFRKVRWVVLPLSISALSNLITMGILGFAEKPITVISSNFISLLAIICISFSIHLIVRYRELLASGDFLDHFDLVSKTMISKFIPCLFTALTTILAFGSMLGSRIVPVEDFGWMMCLGITVAFVVTYLMFPSLLLLLGQAPGSATLGRRVEFAALLNQFCIRRPRVVLGATAVAACVAAVGLASLSFDNRFVDYFDQDTDIHQGIVFIDRHLGGTVPFSVYLTFAPYEMAQPDPEDDFFDGGEDEYPQKYWFTPDRIATVSGVHQFLDSRPETGKVTSLETVERLGRSFNEGQPLSGMAIAMVLSTLPEEIRKQLIEPYARPEAGIMRIQSRIRESGPVFSRDDFLAEVKIHAVEQLGLDADRVTLSGMFVLFNDMLRRLADSQLRTLTYVVGATFLMFSVMLLSLPLALMALVPNLVAAALVISVMGHGSIPMDMMTITIAAISIGIGVDGAIHYLHRYRLAYRETGSVEAAISEAHATIGGALYYTTVTIVAGFSILAFSNFMPTVYFGLLTALAMALALLANLTVLPALLIEFARLIHLGSYGVDNIEPR